MKKKLKYQKVWEGENRMKVDEVITLEDGLEYGLLLESILDNNKYFLAVLLKDGEEPTDTFKVLKEVIKDGKIYALVENDPLILSKLLEDYYLQADDME